MAIDPMSTKVLITGANGFIGLHTVLHFLKGGYNLCATVRTQEQGEKVRQTLAKHTDTTRLEFVQADLTKDEGWDQAVAGCDFVLHLASPFPTDAPKDENELIIPARDGTLRVLRAAQKAGVKRVVLVSSVAAGGAAVGVGLAVVEAVGAGDVRDGLGRRLPVTEERADGVAVDLERERLQVVQQEQGAEDDRDAAAAVPRGSGAADDVARLPAPLPHDVPGPPHPTAGRSLGAQHAGCRRPQRPEGALRPAPGPPHA